MDKQSSWLVGSHAEGNTILYDGQSIRGWLGAMLRAGLYYTMDKQYSWLVGSHAEGKTILYDGQTVLMAGWEPCWGQPYIIQWTNNPHGWLGAMLRARLYYTMDKQSSWLVGSHAGGSPISYNGQTILMAGWEPC